MKLIMLFLSMVLIVTIIHSAEKIPTADMKATLYAIGTERKKAQFFWKMILHADFPKPLKTYYFRPSGTLSVKEELTFDPKTKKIIRYTYSRYENNETAWLDIKKDVVEFNQKIGTKTKKKIEKLTNNFVVGPLIVTFIKDNFQELISGETIQIRYAVIDRLRSFPFKLKIVPNHPKSKKNRYVIKMVPSQFLIRQFVDPLYFIVNMNGDKIYEIIGRTVAIDVQNGKVTPVDSEFIFEY